MGRGGDCKLLMANLGLCGAQHQVRPNVRTYTALITAMCNAQKWEMAMETLAKMKAGGFGGQVEPNAYTYSALLKTMGEKVSTASFS